MRLSHNMFSLGIFKNYSRSLVDNSKALGDVSSGKKLNSAKDNPNKISESENLKIEILCNEAAQSNVQDTNSMLQTFDGALQEVNNNLSRLKQLSVKAATGTNNDGDREIIQKEVEGIKKSIDDLVKNTEFNGTKLSASGATLASPKNQYAKIGALPDEKINLPFYDLSTTGLGIGTLDLSTTAGANAALNATDNATNLVSRIRSKYGAIQSRLESGISTIDEVNETYSKAQSGLEDADIGEEMVEFCRSQIVMQSSLALMAQSNKLPKDALNILANVK